MAFWPGACMMVWQREAPMAKPSNIVNSVATHYVTFEPPNLVHIALIGPLMAAEAEAIITRVHELGREYGPLFWLIDVSQFKLSGERVRDIFLHGGRDRYPIEGGVMCGASFPVRVAMMMALTAGARIAPKSFSFPFEFTATEAEARKWIASMRAVRDTLPMVTEMAAE